MIYINSIMKRLLNIIVSSLLIGTLFSSCIEDKLDPQSWIPVPAKSLQCEDIWLATQYTDTFNVEVKYRWDASESDLTKNMIPARLDYVVPLMSIIKKAWVNPYRQVTGGDEFMCRYMPKLIYLIGSAEINDDGTITQGSAESGRKIIINEVNSFTKEALVATVDTTRDTHTFFHVMHHEFAHILCQKKSYQAEYKSISKGKYTAQWFNVPLYEAREKGFISSYSMAEPDEDFVEIVAWMLTHDRASWEAIINSVRSPEAKSSILLKTDYVVRYFKEAWDIDIYELQAVIDKEIQEILDPSYDIFNVPCNN